MMSGAVRTRSSGTPASVVSGASLVVPRVDIAGHSVPGAGGSVGGDQNAYPDRLAKAIGARRRANVANGGAVACWPSANAQGDGGYSWVLNTFRPPNSGDGNGGYLPSTALAVPHFGVNDLAVLGSQTLKPYVEAMRTILSRYCISALYPDTDPSWTWGSGMSALTGNYAYAGGTARYATVPNPGPTPATQYGQWACPADYPGNLVCAIGLVIVPGAVGAGATMTVTITVDGTPYDAVMGLDKGGHADAEGAKNNGIVLRLGRSDCGLGLPVGQGGLGIPALGPGAHTIRVAAKSTSVNGAYFIVNYAQIEADPLDGPVLVCPSSYRAASPTNGGYNLWAGYLHGPTAGTDPMNDASVTAINAALQGLLADFPGRSVYVDLDTPIAKNPAYLSPTDFTHPTNRGHALIARTIHSAIINSGLVTPRVRDGAQSQRFTDGYDGGTWRPIGGAFNTSIGVAFQNSWAANGATMPTPSYRRDLEGRVHVRGTVKQTGAGAASSLIAALSTLPGYAPVSIRDYPTVTYSGAALGVGQLRADPAVGLFLAGGGQVAAGSFDHVNHDYQAEA